MLDGRSLGRRRHRTMGVEQEAVAIGIAVGYLNDAVHGHPGCNASPPKLVELRSFSVDGARTRGHCQDLVLIEVNWDINEQGPSALDPRGGSVFGGACRYRRFAVDFSRP